MFAMPKASYGAGSAELLSLTPAFSAANKLPSLFPGLAFSPLFKKGKEGIRFGITVPLGRHFPLRIPLRVWEDGMDGGMVEFACVCVSVIIFSDE